MEKDVARLDAINSNYEGRKHGKPSEIFILLSDFIKDHPTFVRNYDYLFIYHKECLPNGQRIKEGSLESFNDQFNMVKANGEFVSDKSATEHVMGKAA